MNPAGFILVLPGGGNGWLRRRVWLVLPGMRDGV